MFKQANLPIAIIAGLAAGFMALEGLRPSPISLVLLIAAPAGIYIAALGWGTLAGVLACAIAISAALVFYGTSGLILTGGLLFFPAAMAGHLANLARPDPAGPGVIWFPLSGILLRLMLTLAAGFVIAGLAMGYQPAAVNSAFRELFGELVATNSALVAPSPAVLEQSAQTYTALLPAVIPAIWLLAHVLVMHLSAIFTARLGVLARPAEDIATSVRLPASALVLPLGGLAGMAALQSPFSEICAVATGIGIAGFALTGLAELHAKTRGWAGRSATLFFAYFLLVVFGFPAIILAIAGAFRSLRNQSVPPSAKTGGGTSTKS